MSILRFLLFIGAAISAGGQCLRGDDYFSLRGRTQGTNYHIICQVAENAAITSGIDSILGRIEKEFSVFDTGSALSRINRNDTAVVLSDMFIELFGKSCGIARQTRGAFDITIGALVEAWGFGSSERKPIDSAQMERLRKTVGYDKVRIEGRRLYKRDPQTVLNFNAIAQGYAVDKAAEFLEAQGSGNYLIEIGGEIRTKGRNAQGAAWRIGIDRPVMGSRAAGNELQEIVLMSGGAVSTSGSYRKYLSNKGKSFSHIIDPGSGLPVWQKLISATVFAGDCATADALATAFMATGLDKAIVLVNELKADVFFIYLDEQGDFAEYYTPAVAQMVQSKQH